MENFKIGDKIINIVDNTEHTIESIEFFKNETVIFTQGLKTKCLPISQVIKKPSFDFLNCIKKMIDDKELTKFEEENLFKYLFGDKEIINKSFDVKKINNMFKDDKGNPIYL
jgi:hypothetical protein